MASLKEDEKEREQEMFRVIEGGRGGENEARDVGEELRGQVARGELVTLWPETRIAASLAGLASAPLSREGLMLLREHRLHGMNLLYRMLPIIKDHLERETESFRLVERSSDTLPVDLVDSPRLAG